VKKKIDALPMPTRVAQAVVAHEHRIPVHKYLDGADLETIQEMVAKLGATRSVALGSTSGNAQSGKRNRASVSAPRTIVFPKEFKTSDPLISQSKIGEAREMASVYPVLYVLENSIRTVIRDVMEAKFGSDWWHTALTSGSAKNLHTKVEQRLKKEDQNFWHQRRGAHAIDYVDIEDLYTIAASKPDIFFPRLLGEQRWFEGFMRELSPSRNVLCHMNPLSEHNVVDVCLKLQKWHEHVKNRLQEITAAKTPNAAI
jgi:hypothetical protein